MYSPDQLHPVQRILRLSLHRFIHQGLPHRPVLTGIPQPCHCDWLLLVKPLPHPYKFEVSTKISIKTMHLSSYSCKTGTFCWNTFECKMVRHRNKTKTQTGWKQNSEGILWNTNEQIHYDVADFCNSDRCIICLILSCSWSLIETDDDDDNYDDDSRKIY